MCRPFPQLCLCCEQIKVSFNANYGRWSSYTAHEFSKWKRATYPIPWLVFFEKENVNAVVIRDSTGISDSMLLLFGGPFPRVVHAHLKMLDGYIELFMEPDLAETCLKLKEELNDLNSKEGTGYGQPQYQDKTVEQGALVESKGMQFVGKVHGNKKLAEKDAAMEALAWFTGISRKTSSSPVDGAVAVAQEKQKCVLQVKDKVRENRKDTHSKN